MTDRTCSVDECDRKHKGLGLCNLHLRRLRETGSTNLAQAPSMADRFWSKVDRTGGPTACWLWTASVAGRGYGHFHVSVSRGVEYAHRVSYEIANGRIPDGLTVEHQCHTDAGDCPSDDTCPHRRCVNPRHLELVTMGENIRRSYANAAAIHRAKTHCPQGHSYAEHGFMQATGRRCRICQREAQRRCAARRRANC